MNGRLWRRSGSAAAVVLVALTLAPAAPAWAAAVITLDKPVADTPVTSPSVTISGSVVSDSPLLSAPKTVTLAMKDQTPAPVSCTDSPCKFSWPVQLPLNGPYDFTVSANDATRLLGIESTAVTQTRKFSVAAPPKKPVLDPPHITDARTVELSWGRNTEPDMLYYAVFRKDPAGSKFLQVGEKVPQPATGKSVTFTDTTTTFLGGDFNYQVVAVRKGATGTAASEVTSDPSAAGIATVPPPPTTTTAAPAPGMPAAGPTTTLKSGTANGVDLSGFLSSRAGPVSLPPITVPEPPDTGFQGTLPFGARPPADNVEEGDPEAVPPSTTRRTTSIVTRATGRPLVPIAGGMVLLLLAVHMRLLNRRIKPVVDGDLPVDLIVPAAPPAEPLIVAEPLVAAPAAPAPPEPAPDTGIYDVLEEEADWAPVPEPVDDELWAPELELDLEPELDVPTQFDGADDFPYNLEPVPVPDEPVAIDEIDEIDLIDEIEVFDVVSPTRRRLARSGSR